MPRKNVKCVDVSHLYNIPTSSTTEPHDWEQSGWVKCVIMNCTHLKHHYHRGLVILNCDSELETCGGCVPDPLSYMPERGYKASECDAANRQNALTEALQTIKGQAVSAGLTINGYPSYGLWECDACKRKWDARTPRPMRCPDCRTTKAIHRVGEPIQAAQPLANPAQGLLPHVSGFALPPIDEECDGFERRGPGRPPHGVPSPIDDDEPARKPVVYGAFHCDACENIWLSYIPYPQRCPECGKHRYIRKLN